MKTKNLIIVLTIYFISTNYSHAQISFENNYKDLRVGRANCVQQTTDGGYIIVGTSTPDPGDIYLIKTDLFGGTLWIKSYGSTITYDEGSSVQQTSDGGYIVVGIQFIYDPTYSQVYTVLIKTNSNGDILWEKKYIGLNSQDPIIGNDVRQTSDGGYVIVGNRYSDVYLIKTNLSGDTLWTKAYDIMQTLEYAEGNFLEQTSDGGYIISGTKTYTQDCTAFLIKTNSTGDTLWTKTYASYNDDQGYSVCQTSDNGYIFAAGGGFLRGWPSGISKPNIYKTNSFGEVLWSRSYSDSLTNICIRSVQQTSDNGYILAGSVNFQKGLLIKTNSSGDTLWTRTYRNYTDPYYESISVLESSDGGYVIAGDNYDFLNSEYEIFLIKTLPDGSVLPVEQEPLTPPEKFSLEQNFPNPFNPSTTIKYSIPASEFVMLKVYDVLGNEVATLVNEEKPAGSYELDFNASQLSSGIYFYKLQVGPVVETKKMILSK